MIRWVRQLLCSHSSTVTRMPAMRVIGAVCSGDMSIEEYRAWKWEPDTTTCCHCGKEWTS